MQDDRGRRRLNQSMKTIGDSKPRQSASLVISLVIGGIMNPTSRLREVARASRYSSRSRSLLSFPENRSIGTL